jgi:hypothetical protein
VTDIRSRRNSYFVREALFESDVRVLEEPRGEVMVVSTREVLSRNHLRNLPDC